MSIKINYAGIEITVNSTGEAAALVQQLSNPQASMPTNTSVVSPVIAPRIPSIREQAVHLPTDKFVNPFENYSTDHQVIFDFLNAIAQSGAEGIGQEEMMKALKVEHPKGVGGRSVRINNWLARNGFRLQDVYETQKTASGRVWQPRHRIQEAISKLI